MSKLKESDSKLNKSYDISLLNRKKPFFHKDYLKQLAIDRPKDSMSSMHD